MTWRAGFAAIAAAMLAAPLPGWACSMVPGYRVPTNLELAMAAEVIVVATVDGERSAGDGRIGKVIARPTLLIKGSSLPAVVEIDNTALDDKLPRRAARSDPRELREPNPDALAGGCVRYVFTRGMKLVLFLKRDSKGVLQPYRSSFSRDSEDVPSDDALWVKAVREYVEISKLSKAGRKAGLKRRAAELRATGDADSVAIANDMAIELTGKRLPPTD